MVKVLSVEDAQKRVKEGSLELMHSESLPSSVTIASQLFHYIQHTAQENSSDSVVYPHGTEKDYVYYRTIKPSFRSVPRQFTDQ